MIGTSFWDYVFIRTCIFFLYLITPLSVLYTLTASLIYPPYYIPRILDTWLALEAAFYVIVYLPRKAYLQTPATHPETLCSEDRRKLFGRCHRHIPEPEQYLTKLFRDAPTAEIKRENLKEFFRWAFFNLAEPDPAYEDELQDYTEEIERLLGRKLEDGRDNAKCLRLTLEQVNMLHRSLIWYPCVFVVDVALSISLRYHSFDFYSNSLVSVFPLRPLSPFSPFRSPAKTVTCWHRPHTSKERLPVLLIHGIGIGLYPYINFLAEINARHSKERSDRQVGIIALELMHISSRITSEAIPKEDMCEEVRRVLDAYGWKRFVLVSHSYGSVIATHLLHTPNIAQRIGPILFIDPVSFLLYLPDVAYNFLFQKPTRANEYQLSYFASKDMSVSHTLFRRFFWAENILWKEDIQGHQATMVLAGRDLIVDTKAVAAYLTGADDWMLETGGRDRGLEGDALNMVWFQDLDHGQVFDKRRTRQLLVDIMRRYSREG